MLLTIMCVMGYSELLVSLHLRQYAGEQTTRRKFTNFLYVGFYTPINTFHREKKRKPSHFFL